MQQKILVSGSTGLIGSALMPLLSSRNFQITRLIRTEERTANERSWQKLADLDSYDAVIHLAGLNVGGGRWTDSFKQKIRDSRVITTKRLCETLATAATKPKVILCASGAGYYGHRGDELLTESSSKGSGFLADVVEEWERACDSARSAGIRVVHTRFAVVLSPKGGALKKLLLPFKLGLGGRIGNGGCNMSWVSLDDCIEAIYHLIITDSLEGAVNVAAPQHITNLEFTGTLGKILRRPAIIPIPVRMLKLVYGKEMIEQTILSDSVVVPKKLTDSGFRFRHESIENALRFLLGKQNA